MLYKDTGVTVFSRNEVFRVIWDFRDRLGSASRSHPLRPSSARPAVMPREQSVLSPFPVKSVSSQGRSLSWQSALHGGFSKDSFQVKTGQRR